MEGRFRRENARRDGNHVTDDDTGTPHKRPRTGGGSSMQQTDGGSTVKFGSFPNSNNSIARNIQPAQGTFQSNSSLSSRPQQDSSRVQPANNFVDLTDEPEEQEPNVPYEKAVECQQKLVEPLKDTARALTLRDTGALQELDAARAELQGVQAELEQLRQQRVEEQQSVSGTIATLKREHLTAMAATNEVNVQLQAELDVANADLAALKHSAQSEQSANALAAELASGRAAVLLRELTATKAELGRMQVEREQQMTAQAKQQADTQSAKTEWQQALDAKSSALLSAMRERDELQMKLDECNARLEASRSVAVQQARSDPTARQQLERSEQENERLRRYANEQCGLVLRLQAALKASEQKYREIQQQQQQQQQQQRQAAAAELATARVDRDRIQQELAECRAKLALAGVAAAGKTTAEQQLHTQAVLLQQLEDRNCVLQEQVALKQSEVEALTKAAQDASKKHQQAQKDGEQARSEVAQLQQELNVRAERVQQLERAVAGMAVEGGNAKRECERQSAERSQLLAERKRLRSELAAVQTDLDESRRLYASAEERITRIQADRAKERAKLNSVHAEEVTKLVQRVVAYERVVAERQQPSSPSGSRSGPPLPGSSSSSRSAVGIATVVDWRNTLSAEARQAVGQLEGTVADLQHEVAALRDDLTRRTEQVRDLQRKLSQALENAMFR